MPLRKHAWARRSSSAARADGARPPAWRSAAAKCAAASRWAPSRAARSPAAVEYSRTAAPSPGGLGVMREPRRARRARPARPAPRDAGRRAGPAEARPRSSRVRSRGGSATASPSARSIPGRQARVELRQLVRRDPLEQPDLRSWPRDRDGLQQPPRGGGQARRAGEHGVAHAAGRAHAAAREHLGHEERVAAGPRMQAGAVDAVRRRQPRDRVPRQRLDGHPLRAASARRAPRAAGGRAPARRRDRSR